MPKLLSDIPVRVLVVDDERQVGEFLCDFLEARGFEVFYTDNGEEAIRIVKRARPHIALLDILMPGMSGLELLARIREIDPRVGNIMITALSEEELGRKSLRLGAVDYIVKPVDVNYLETSLLVKISNLLE